MMFKDTETGSWLEARIVQRPAFGKLWHSLDADERFELQDAFVDFRYATVMRAIDKRRELEEI